MATKQTGNTRNTVYFVCTGNICRSPMGEALLKHAIDALGADSKLKNLKVESAGVSTIDGMGASAFSVEALKRVGLDIKGHRSKLLTQKMVDNAAAIFAMDQTHLDAVRRNFKNLPHILKKVTDFVENEHLDAIADPYGGSLEEYLEARDDIVSAIPNIVKYLENEIR